MKTRYKFIHFIHFEKGAARDVEYWVCYNTKDSAGLRGGKLGWVEYYETWRKYVFSTDDFASFDAQCLLDIAHFMGQLKQTKDDKAK